MIHQAIKSMLDKYNPKTIQEYENALKEIIQQAVLAGLWRANFFNYAAFYGGSALRIFFGLERFSEDLDFTLLEKNAGFHLNKYFSALENELIGLGFDVYIEQKEKQERTQIDSAFIKTDTLITLINADVPKDITATMPEGKLLKIKFEIDIDPPCEITTETKFLLSPVPCSVRLASPGDLFAGKVHALLFRKWKERVKGRDWYDFIWFITSGMTLNLFHLSRRIIQSENISGDYLLNQDGCIELLQQAVSNLDIEKAKRDVLPYLKNLKELDIWSKDFFYDLIQRINYK